jgi:hypothetical protein
LKKNKKLKIFQRKAAVERSEEVAEASRGQFEQSFEVEVGKALAEHQRRLQVEVDSARREIQSTLALNGNQELKLQRARQSLEEVQAQRSDLEQQLLVEAR